MHLHLGNNGIILKKTQLDKYNGTKITETRFFKDTKWSKNELEGQKILDSMVDQRIQVIRNRKNYGLTRSLNIGSKLAKGQYVARMDADDLSRSSRLEKQVQFLDQNPNVILAGTQANLINRYGKKVRGIPAVKKPCSHNAIKWFCMFDNPFYHSSVMFRSKIILDELNGYNEDFYTNQDYELWSRLVNKYQAVNLPFKLIDLRVHNNSISSNYSLKSKKLIESIIYNYIHLMRNKNIDLNLIKTWATLILKPGKISKSEAIRVKNHVENLYKNFNQNSDEIDYNEILHFKACLNLRIAYLLADYHKLFSLKLFITNANKIPTEVADIFLKYFLKTIIPNWVKLLLRRSNG